LSELGESGPRDDELVLVFRPPENPAAQIAVDTPFRGHRIRIDELLDWFKALKVEKVELWIEGAKTLGKNTELFLSTEGKSGAKITLRPHIDTLPQQQHDQTEKFAIATSQTGSQDKASSIVPIQQSSQAIPPSVPAVMPFFSPNGGIEQQILSKLGGATDTVEVAAYAFTNQNIAQSLLDAVKRGVKVSLVMDRSQTKGTQASIHDDLQQAGAAIRLISPPGGIMHDKFMIIDGKSIEWGSYNYTDRAENANFENATFRSDDNLAQKYHANFESIYGQATLEAQGFARPMRRFFRRIRSVFKPRA
jgi:phosphatidylserine/phosphatidylglycerophosphate/cardiolipin synthase-like enzyme